MSFAVYVLDWVGALKGKGVWVRMYWHEAADAYLEALMGDGAGGDPDEAICARMGMDAATWRAVGAAQAAMAASRPRTCDD